MIPDSFGDTVNIFNICQKKTLTNEYYVHKYVQFRKLFILINFIKVFI